MEVLATASAINISQEKSTATIEPRVIKKYPMDTTSVSYGTATVTGRFQRKEEMQPGQTEPEVVVISPKSGTAADRKLARELLSTTLKNRVQQIAEMDLPIKGEVKEGQSPTVIKMSEYQKKWAPQGWKIIFIGPTSSWRQEWGSWEAIRDIVQNALDESEAYQYGYDAKGLWIADQGKGIGIADFLLGPPKLKSSYARGRFGEGMKISCLALLREGYPVHIDTVGREVWVIFIEQEIDGKAQSLAALWRPGGTTAGTKFHIIGYTGPAYEDHFAVNLPKSYTKAWVPSPLWQPLNRYNQLIEIPADAIEKSYKIPGALSGSRIYARDIFMRMIDSPFSYNLWGFDLAPDRHGPARESDVWNDAGRVWCGITEVRLLEMLFRMVKEPADLETEESHLLNMMQYNLGTNPETERHYTDMIVANKASWKKAWANVSGENTVLRLDESRDAMVKHLGYESVSVSYGVRQTLATVIETDLDLILKSQERLSGVQIIPDGKLNESQLVHLELARGISKSLQGGTPITGVHAAVIPPASDRVRTAGMYNRKTAEVYISAGQLSSARSTVDTVIHEEAHHTSGAEDGEEAHNRELSRLGGDVVYLARSSYFDYIVQKPGFKW